MTMLTKPNIISVSHTALKDVDLILSDIDGTFMSSSVECKHRDRLLAQNLAALERAEAKGITVAFVTGRAFSTCYDFFGEERRDWLAKRPGAFLDGSHVLGEDGELARVCSVPRSVLSTVLDALKDNEKVGLVAFSGAEILSSGDAAFADHHQRHFGGPDHKAVTFEELKLMDVQAVVFYDFFAYSEEKHREITGCSAETIAVMEKALAASADSDAAKCLKVKRTLVRLLAPGQTKGTAAQFLVQSLQKSKPILLGDDLNDVPMFEAFPGQGVAMGNAFEGAIAAAGMVTGRCDAHPVSGWAQAVDAVVAAKAAKPHVASVPKAALRDVDVILSDI